MKNLLANKIILVSLCVFLVAIYIGNKPFEYAMAVIHFSACTYYTLKSNE